MATAKQLDNATQCQTCFEVYTDPRVLTCGHTYCLKCIEAWSKEKQKVTCPHCRKEFIVPKNGVSELPRNFAIIDMVRVLLDDDNTTRGPPCDTAERTGEPIDCVLPRDATHSQSAVMRLYIVCLSVRMSVCDDEVCFSHSWNTSKIISRTNSLRHLLTLTTTWAIWCKGKTAKIRVEYGWGQEHKNVQNLRNGARLDQGYDGLIGSSICAFDWCQIQ